MQSKIHVFIRKRVQFLGEVDETPTLIFISTFGIHVSGWKIVE